MKRATLVGATVLTLALSLGYVGAQPATARIPNARGLWHGLAEGALASSGGGGQLGRGQVRPRPAEGREPEFPAPSIREYKPRSTLVVPQHQVPRAKFPVIDIHGHPPHLSGPDAVNQVVQTMDPLNLQVMINASGASGNQLRQSLDAIQASRFKERMVMFTQLDLHDVGPGSGERIARQLEADIKAGALGVGEIMKSFGLTIRKSDGSRLKVDDPELDPIWQTAARLNIPVFIHVADPAEFFEPLDYRNERWMELALFPDRRYQDRSRFPDFETLMGERDRLIARHPKTTWVLAHLGWHAQDLGRLGAMFDKQPNLYAEVGAVLYDIGRQPRFAHDFFVKYQDRLLFGKDSYQPDEYPYYWRVFETNDEYFDYYRDYHAFWKLYGIGLPDTVLRKLYYGNALKIVPNLPRAGFPPV
jgi:predicted TIM-barrel fold metal-dependent hydrolase